jgi:transposase-like protein
MPACPRCQRPAPKRNGTDRVGRQRLLCRLCGRSFTSESLSVFAGYHWPAEVVLTAVRG